MNIDAYIPLLVAKILKYSAAPGKLLVIYKSDLPCSTKIQDLSILLCDDVKRALAYNNYLLISELCTSDYLVVLDIHFGYQQNLDFVSVIEYSFDSQKGAVTSRIIDNFPIDPDFSMTPEQLEALVMDLRPKYLVGNVVTVKGKRGKWSVSYVYTPWEENMKYSMAYSAMKFRCPQERYFYALNAIGNNQKPIIELQGNLELITKLK